MSEWKEYRLGEVATFSYGKLPKKELLGTGDFVTYSGYKYIDTYPDFNCEKGDVILVARGVGGTGNVKLTKKKCFLTNLSIKISLDNRYVLNDFFYNMFRLENLRYLDSGSAQSQITIQDLFNVIIEVPPIEEQRRIAGVLGALDEKIDLLNRENATLEALAETLFRHYFIENPDPTWKEGKLENVVEVLDYRRKPLSKMERDKMKNGNILYPYYGAAEIMDYIDDYLFDGEYILLGEDGTVRTDDGHPILQLATGKFWPNNHAHVLQAMEPFNNCFLWYYFKTTNIDEIVTGAVQPKINQANLMSLPVYDYPIEIVEEFQNTAEPIWNKIKSNQQQMQTLAVQRDTLLPRLMSGEVKVTKQ